MRRFCCLAVVVLAPAIFTLALSDAAWSQEPEVYYLVGDDKVPLTPSQDYRALKVKPGMSAAAMTAFKSTISASGVAEVEPSPLLERHGIVLVRIKTGVGPSSFRESVQALTARAEVEQENPVYTVRGADHVLVNEFIVQFEEDVSKEAIEKSLGDKGAKVVSMNPKIANRYVISFPGKSAREALDLSNAYAGDDPVVFCEPNFAVIVPARPRINESGVEPQAPPSGEATESPEGAATPIDPLFPFQWSLHNLGTPEGENDADVDAPKAWDLQKGNGTIIVAIIDEGVDTDHPDLQAKIVTPYDATDGDNDQEPNSWDGHGTACAGIAAAMTNNSKGVAGIGWDVKILPVRMALSSHEGGDWITTYSIIEDGIRTAVDRGAHVLSNSWGGGNSNLVNSAIDHAIANNRVVVFAAGNDAGAVSWPANLSTSKVLIAVSATNKWDEFKTMTTQDNETWWGSNFGPEVSVSAPGVQMYTTDIAGSDGYASGDYVANFNGTSSATPLVAGTAALVLAQNPGWTPAQVRNRLQTAADDLGTAGFDTEYGHGRVNACKALGGTDCEEGGSPPPEPPNCSALAPVGTPGGGQTMVNLALLLSTLLLFLLIPLGRRALAVRR